MKVKILISLFIGAIGLIIYNSASNTVHGNSFGAPLISGKGYTGSPFDNRACNVSGCHTGTLNNGTGIPEITHNIPASGYKLGERYSITAKISQSGKTKFGFQLTAETNSNQKTGNFLAGAQTRAPSDFYVTQGTSSSTTAGNGSKSWTVNWDAPNEPGDGEITFYAAFNVANGNGSSSGDQIYTTKTTVIENITNGIESTGNNSPLVYPNPATSIINIEIPSHNIGTIEKLEIRNINGSIIQVISPVSAGKKISIDVDNFNRGIYYVIGVSESEQFVNKIIIQ